MELMARLITFAVILYYGSAWLGSVRVISIFILKSERFIIFQFLVCCEGCEAFFADFWILVEWEGLLGKIGEITFTTFTH